MSEESGKIKLVQVIADSKIGGGPKHVLGILRNIDKSIFDVYLICPSGYLSVEGKLVEGITVINLPFYSKFDLSTIFRLKDVLRQIQAKGNPFGPMIVHSHGTRAGFIARIGFTAPRRAKMVYTEHRLDSDYHLSNPINDWVQKKILSAQNSRTDLIIAVSSSVKKYLLRSSSVLKEKVKVIPNGVELDEFRKKVNIKEVKTVHKAPIIGNIGNLNIQKGQIYLIEAMPEILKKHPLATLEIIGEGPERGNLLKKIKQLKLSRNVTLLGNKNDIARYFDRFDVFVLPSIAETFGIAILESMSVGVPVVASKVGGIPDIITDHKNGILVPPKNPKKIAEAILEVIDHPASAAKLKREGLLRARDFEWADLVKRLENEYINLLKEING